MISSPLPGFLGFGFSVLLGVVIIAAWVILAGSRFIQGGVVERPERVPQLYGYTVCLIALVWSIVSVLALVDEALTYSSPELRSRDEFGWDASVSSFEAFRTSYDRVRRFSVPSPEEKLDSIPEAELRRRYEAMRADRIVRGKFEARRRIIISLLSLMISTALFVFHWRWLKGRVATSVAQS